MNALASKCWLIVFSLILLSGPVAKAQVAGPGSALNLNGSTGYIQATNNVWFSGDFTVEAWVFVRSYTSWARLIDFANGPNNQNVYVALSAGFTGKPAMGVFTNTGVPVVQATSQLPLNQWVHLAATLNGTNGTIYINGNVVGSGTRNIPPNATRTNNYIGRSNFSNDQYANAIFDEVRIWNVARTQSQIQANMGRSLSGTETNLLAYWRFDEGAGTNLVDSSLQGQGATVQGGVTWTNSTAPIRGGPASPASAISFNGSTGYATAPADSWFNSDFTVESWVYMRSNSPWATLIDFSQSFSNNVEVFLAGPVFGGGYTITFQIISNDVYYPWLSTPTNTLPLNEWMHIACTLNGTAATIYTNGSVAAFYDPLPLPPAVVRDSNFIGRGPSGGASCATGVWPLTR